MAWLVVLVVLLAGIPLASQAATPFQLDDLQKLVKLSGPQFAPDGKSIVLVLDTPVWKTDKHDTRIEIVDVVSGAQWVLTQGREDVSSPRSGSPVTTTWEGGGVGRRADRLGDGLHHRLLPDGR